MSLKRRSKSLEDIELYSHNLNKWKRKRRSVFKDRHRVHCAIPNKDGAFEEDRDLYDEHVVSVPSKPPAPTYTNTIRYKFKKKKTKHQSKPKAKPKPNSPVPPPPTPPKPPVSPLPDPPDPPSSRSSSSPSPTPSHRKDSSSSESSTTSKGSDPDPVPKPQTRDAASQTDPVKDPDPPGTVFHQKILTESIYRDWSANKGAI